jgi:hypothetical protein
MALSVSSAQLIDLGSLGITGYPFTLAGWFRVPNVNNLVTLMGIGFSTTGSYHRLVYAGSTTKVAGAMSFVTSSATATSSIVMTPNVWHHVVGVFESATSRRVYLDGGNSGTSSQSRVFDGANQHYLGSQSADAVEVAEAAVFKVALTAGQIAQLAAAYSPLCLPVFQHLLTYQSCIRRLNWPARGPMASAGGLTDVPHPRTFHRRNASSQLMPLRRWGPFHSERGASRTCSLNVGQPRVAGVAGNGGQVMVGGLITGLSGEVQS